MCGNTYVHTYCQHQHFEPRAKPKLPGISSNIHAAGWLNQQAYIGAEKELLFTNFRKLMHAHEIRSETFFNISTPICVFSDHYRYLLCFCEGPKTHFFIPVLSHNYTGWNQHYLSTFDEFAITILQLPFMHTLITPLSFIQSWVHNQNHWCFYVKCSLHSLHDITSLMWAAALPQYNPYL